MNKHILAPDKWVEVCAEISGEWLQDVVSEYPYVTQYPVVKACPDCGNDNMELTVYLQGDA